MLTEVGRCVMLVAKSPDEFTSPLQCGPCPPVPTSLLFNFLRGDHIHCLSQSSAPWSPRWGRLTSIPSSNSFLYFIGPTTRGVSGHCRYFPKKQGEVGKTTLGPRFLGQHKFQTLFTYHVPILWFKNILCLHHGVGRNRYPARANCL